MLPAGELVDGSVSIDQGEFEFRNGQAEHREIDRAAARHGRKAPSEQGAILGRSVEPREHRLTNGIVAIAAGIRRGHGGSQTVIELVELWTDGSVGSGEAGDLRQFGRRHLRLRLCEDQDHRVVRGNRVVPSGGGKTKPNVLSNGLPDAEAKRPFHISFGKNTVLSSMGVRRWLRGPWRLEPAMLLF